MTILPDDLFGCQIPCMSRWDCPHLIRQIGYMPETPQLSCLPCVGIAWHYVEVLAWVLSEPWVNLEEAIVGARLTRLRRLHALRQPAASTAAALGGTSHRGAV
jgi:hypothetical protein